MSSASFSDTREFNSARADFVNDFTKLVEEKVRERSGARFADARGKSRRTTRVNSTRPGPTL